MVLHTGDCILSTLLFKRGELGFLQEKKSGFSSGVDDLLVDGLWKLLHLAMSWVRQCVLDPPLQYSAAALRFSRSFPDETQTAECHVLLKQRRHTLTRARNPHPSCAQSGTYIPIAFPTLRLQTSFCGAQVHSVVKLRPQHPLLVK